MDLHRLWHENTLMAKETRLEKAHRLLDTGCLVDFYRGKHGAKAFVLGDHGEYLCIITFSGGYNCACMWGQCHPNSTDRCSHALAVALAAGKETSCPSPSRKL